MGKAVLKDIAKKRKLDIVVDSCGTASYHVGESPDERYVFSSYWFEWAIAFGTADTSFGFFLTAATHLPLYHVICSLQPVYTLKD